MGFSRFTEIQAAGLLTTVKTLLRPFVVLVLGLALISIGLLGTGAADVSKATASKSVSPSAAPAIATPIAPAAPKTASPAPTSAGSASSASAHKTPGVEVAQAISTITGVAISPLLGVGAIGAWKYYKTHPDKRADLPWFAQTWFWAPALMLVVIVFLKDTAGTALPTALKKPLDIAEVFENKISALVAAGAFIPLVATIVKAIEPESSLYDGVMLAVIDPSTLLNLITIPLAIFVFFIVWMVSHVINVLIIVSPFTTVDAALKSVRLVLLSSVTLTSFANPYVGAAWALVIIIASYFLAGWALRLTVFGTVFAWDFLTFRSARTKVAATDNMVFTAKAIGETPLRSYGRLRRDATGRLTLTYRPWLILPARELVLPSGTYIVGRGLLYPEIIRVDNDSTDAVLTLAPRYNGHEEDFNQVYQLAGVQNIGLQAWWEWVKDAVRSRLRVPSTAN
jgi:hypothetical protein